MKLKKLIEQALREDRAGKDITCSAVKFSSSSVSACIKAKGAGVVCGLDVIKEVFRRVSSGIKVSPRLKDGDLVEPGLAVVSLQGPPDKIFSAERTALNFLCRLSGISTLTSTFVREASPVPVYDTRKTTPGHRDLEKYAVRTGGGKNHRRDLSCQVLIKENHIGSATEKNIEKLLIEVRKEVPGDIKIEIEVENLDQLSEALRGPADIIMVDNFTPGEALEAVRMARSSARPDVEIEISGGITRENIKDFALSGADRISVGTITSAAPVLDFSLVLDR